MEEQKQEIITIAQFAERMSISRSTAYAWLTSGHLIPGRHVIRINQVIRILWTNDLISHLLAISMEQSSGTERPRLKRNGKGGRNRIAFDITYLEKT